jgi:DNA-binding transcriptional MerR regulator
MAEPGAAHLSIGEVLGLLLEEFPDVTISKIRFLESQGLIEPERTASGYRKFFDDDVELLRVILREQREKFLPLRVIKDRIDSGQIEKPDPTPPRGMAAEQPTAAHVAKHPAGGATPSGRPAAPPAASTPPDPAPAPATAPAPAPAASGNEPGARLLPGVLVNRDELCAMASVTRDQLAQLEEYGVVPKRSGGDLYGDEAVEIAAAAGGFLRAGVDARHLRAWRTSVEREAGLYEQLIVPMLRQRNPQARSQAASQLSDLDALGARLRAAMMRAALRPYLE